LAIETGLENKIRAEAQAGASKAESSDTMTTKINSMENGRTKLVARSKSKLNHTDQTNKASHRL
jgi:hypothetical protein